jgi:hypothetical protein
MLFLDNDIWAKVLYAEQANFFLNFVVTFRITLVKLDLLIYCLLYIVKIICMIDTKLGTLLHPKDNWYWSHMVKEQST